jgi:hypothetical protein
MSPKASTLHKVPQHQTRQVYIIKLRLLACSRSNTLARTAPFHLLKSQSSTWRFTFSFQVGVPDVPVTNVDIALTPSGIDYSIDAINARQVPHSLCSIFLLEIWPGYHDPFIRTCTIAPRESGGYLAKEDGRCFRGAMGASAIQYQPAETAKADSKESSPSHSTI